MQRPQVEALVSFQSLPLLLSSLLRSGLSLNSELAVLATVSQKLQESFALPAYKGHNGVADANRRTQLLHGR